MRGGGRGFTSHSWGLEAVDHDLVVETQPSEACAYLPGRAAVREAEDPPPEAPRHQKNQCADGDADFFILTTSLLPN
jgi:hypothetical protein